MAHKGKQKNQTRAGKNHTKIARHRRAAWMPRASPPGGRRPGYTAHHEPTLPGRQQIEPYPENRVAALPWTRICTRTRARNDEAARRQSPRRPALSLRAVAEPDMAGAMDGRGPAALHAHRRAGHALPAGIPGTSPGPGLAHAARECGINRRGMSRGAASPGWPRRRRSTFQARSRSRLCGSSRQSHPGPSRGAARE